jgi:hypothetical protein
VHKSAAGNGKLPATASAFVLIPAGDGVIPGAAAMDAGKSLGPADAEQLDSINLFVHGKYYIPKMSSFLSCNNLILSKTSEIFMFLTDFRRKSPNF